MLSHLLLIPLRLFRLALDLVTDLIYAAIYDASGRDNRIPPIEDVILLDSATALAEKIRNKKVEMSMS